MRRDAIEIRLRKDGADQFKAGIYRQTDIVLRPLNTGTQDVKRPSSRFGLVLRTLFTDIDWKNTLPIQTGCCFTRYMERQCGMTCCWCVTSAININTTDLTRLSGSKQKKACLWSSHRMLLDGYSVPSYGGYTYSIPEGCRPQVPVTVLAGS